MLREELSYENLRPLMSFTFILSVAILWWRTLSTKSASSTPSRSDSERQHLRSRILEAASKRTTVQETHPRKQTTKRRQQAMPKTTLPEPTSKAPRKATLAEEMRYREEKISQEQFGFSIYGSTDYCFDCVSPPAVTTNRSSNFGLGIHSIGVIANLPGSAQVYKELERLRDEFDPIVRARGWKVLNLTEMCCCGDGDETLPGKTSDRGRHDQPHVMGYCASPNDNRIAQGIHIRCRVAHSCRDGLRLFPYAELVQTMCHELAHIAVGSHNAQFYRLMKELEDEYNLQKLEHSWGSGRTLGRH